MRSLFVALLLLSSACGDGGAGATNAGDCARPDRVAEELSSALFDVAERAAAAARARCERASIQAYSETSARALDASRTIPCEDEEGGEVARAEAAAALESIRRAAEGEPLALGDSRIGDDDIDAAYEAAEAAASSWTACGAPEVQPPPAPPSDRCEPLLSSAREAYRVVAFAAWRAAVYRCPGLTDAPGEPPHCASAQPLAELALGAVEVGAETSPSVRVAFADALAFARQRTDDIDTRDALDAAFAIDRRAVGCQRADRVAQLLAAPSDERLTLPGTRLSIARVEGLGAGHTATAALPVFGGELRLFTMSAAREEDAVAFLRGGGFAPLPGHGSIWSARVGEGALEARGWVRVLSVDDAHAMLFASFQGPATDPLSNGVVALLESARLDGALFDPGPAFSLARDELPILGADPGQRWLYSAGRRGPESFGVVIGRQDGGLTSRGEELCAGRWPLEGEVVSHGELTLAGLRGCHVAVRATERSFVVLQLSDGDHRLDIEVTAGRDIAAAEALARVRRWLASYRPRD